MVLAIQRITTSDNYIIEFKKENGELTASVTDLFDRLVLNQVKIVSSISKQMISEYLTIHQKDRFAVQFFLKEKVVWIGPFGLSGGMYMYRQTNTQTETIRQPAPLVLHLNNRQTSDFTTTLREHLRQLRLYMTDTPEIARLVTDLARNVENWDSDLQPRLRRIATTLEEENAHIQSTLLYIRNHPEDALSKIKELISRAKSLLKKLMELKEDIFSNRGNLLSSQAETQTLSDEIERKAEQLRVNVAYYSRRIATEEAKVKDYNDNYGYQWKKNVAVGIGFGLIGLIAAESFGGGPYACDQLRQNNNEAQERLPNLRRSYNEASNRENSSLRAQNLLRAINVEITSLLQRIDRQRAALENGIQEMERYVETLESAERGGNNFPVRARIAQRVWDNASGFFQQL